MKTFPIAWNKKIVSQVSKKTKPFKIDSNKGLFAPIEKVIIDGHEFKPLDIPIFDLENLANDAIKFLRTSEDEIAKEIRAKITGFSDSQSFFLQLLGGIVGIVGGKRALAIQKYSDELAQKSSDNFIKILNNGCMVAEEINKFAKHQKNTPKIVLYGTKLNETSKCTHIELSV